MIWKTIPFQLRLAGRAQIALRNITTSNALRKNLYEVLGVSREASQADIKNAYFELTKKYHPDRIEATDENLTMFREISAAYEILGNEQSRKLYDKGLIGDFKRVGVDDSQEVLDPIVKFYKKRQELSKFLDQPSETVKSWSPDKKPRIAEKYNFFRSGSPVKYESEDRDKYIYAFGVMFLACIFWLANIRDTNTRRFLDRLFS